LYKNGLKNGYGEYYTKTGEVMKCNWIDNKPHGKGVLITADGQVMEAKWENGNLLIMKQTKK
jgi:hypothetical protein